MYLGWASFGGVELFNSARTKAYFDHVGIGGFSLYDCVSCDNFAEIMGDKDYTSPFVDQPAWVDPDNPDTWDFFGFYPLSAEGVEGSTITATPIELTTDGGYVSGSRMAGREMRFTGLLIGRTTAAVQAGMTWFKHALEGDACRANPGCAGDHFCYLASCPEVCEDSPDALDNPDPVPLKRLCPNGTPAEWPDQCVVPYERHMLGVSCIEGPLLTTIHESNCGTQIWEVEFTLYAGVPGPYGTPRWVGCVNDQSDLPSRLIGDDNCSADNGPQPIQDPDCRVPLPPRPPTVPDLCITDPDQWRRYQFDVPDPYIPEWADTVPILTINTKKEDVRQLRIRFYANPFGKLRPDLIDESCDFCGEFLVSYIPKNSTMVIDGMERSAIITTHDGATATAFNSRVWTASHLLYGSGGMPMSWPILTCGTGYAMTVDVVPDKITHLEICLCLATRE